MKEYNISRHYQNKHSSQYDKFKDQFQTMKLKELKAQLNQQQTCFKKICKSNVATVTASYELSQMITVSGKPYIDGAFIKNCLIKTVETLCPDKAHLFKDLSLTRNTVATRIDEMSANLKEQIKTASANFEYFSLAIDETCDISALHNLRSLFELVMLSYK